MGEQTVVVHWEGPFEWDECSKHWGKGHVLYALYGSHHLYGRDVLLYLGRDDVAHPIECHGRWIENEYDAMKVRFASIGKFEGWAERDRIERYDPPADRSLVANVEALLIRAHQPAYNMMNKGALPNAGLRILNTGRMGHLLPEISSLYYATEGTSENEGVIDTERNPFARPSWIKQDYTLTPDRKGELAPLFGKTVQEIMSGDDNTCRYPAFVGIRWGFAVICICGRLVPTEK